MEFITSPSTYTYRPLNNPASEIRLLKYTGISHHLSSARLSFEVITVTCPRDPNDTVEPFYAVSYSWGSNLALTEIILDGHETDVPYASEEALRGLIKSFSAGAGDVNTPIWIDAICMNQKDFAEKEKQLPLMKWIYSCASEVCVWLGPADLRIVSGLRVLNLLKEEKVAWFLENGKDAIPPNGNLEPPDGCDWIALGAILALPWFTRVWTMQEIVLARPGKASISLGRYTFSWDEFTDMVQWAWDTHRDYDIMPDEVNKLLFPAVMMMRVKAKKRVPLSRLLIASTGRGVTNQEDRIYGMLGMRPEEDIAKGTIEVKVGRPLSETYTAATAMIMETENSLLLLQQMANTSRIGYTVRIGDSGEEEPWPSWVPRLDIQDQRRVDDNLNSPTLDVQRANANNGIPAPIIHSTPSKKLLHLRGIRIGQVEMAFEPLTKNKFLTTPIEKNQWLPIDVARHFSYLWDPPFITTTTATENNSSRETIIALADSLTIDGYAAAEEEEGQLHRDEELIQDFGALMSESWGLLSETDRLRLPRPTFTLPENNNTGDIRRFVSNVAGRAARFSHLKFSGGGAGRFGMGPSDTLCEDVAVILLGVCVPLILRREGKGERYRILGTVYVTGVMQGQYLQGLLEEDELEGRLETFDIC